MNPRRRRVCSWLRAETRALEAETVFYERNAARRQRDPNDFSWWQPAFDALDPDAPLDARDKTKVSAP